MKKLFYIISISLFLFLASCKSVCSTNMMQTTPDTLNKPTETVVAKDTVAEISKGTWVKTDPDQKLVVTLEEDTVAFVKTDTKAEATLPPEKPQEIILPKNTPIILPENTYLQTSDSAKVTIDAKTEVVLPQGTEITISRINWYAILFYMLVILGLAWYYIQGKTEDKDGDGFVDDKINENKT
jgi:hypothetical protein